MVRLYISGSWLWSNAVVKTTGHISTSKEVKNSSHIALICNRCSLYDNQDLCFRRAARAWRTRKLVSSGSLFRNNSFIFSSVDLGNPLAIIGVDIFQKISSLIWRLTPGFFSCTDAPNFPIWFPNSSMTSEIAFSTVQKGSLGHIATRKSLIFWCLAGGKSNFHPFCSKGIDPAKTESAIWISLGFRAIGPDTEIVSWWLSNPGGGGIWPKMGINP